MMPYPGQRRIPPQPFLPERPLHPQGKFAPSTQLPLKPSSPSSPLCHVKVKEEPKEDPSMPPPGPVAKRFTPYTGYLPRSTTNEAIIKQEPGTAPLGYSEPISRPPPQSLGESVSTAAGLLDLQGIHPGRRKLVRGFVQDDVGGGAASSAADASEPYDWLNEYTPIIANSFAGTLGTQRLPKADQKDLLKILVAAKDTVLELLSEEEKKRFNLHDVPFSYYGLKKVARELDLIIPHTFAPKGQDVLPMDRIIRAAQKYTDHLRQRQVFVPKDDLNYKTQEIAHGQMQTHANYWQGIAEENKKTGASSKENKKDTKIREKSKDQTSENETVVPGIQLKPKASKKRMHESNSGAEEEFVSKASKKKKQNFPASAIDQEMLAPELNAPKPEKKNKKKRAMIQCFSSGENILQQIPPEKKKKKKKSPPSDENAPDPATEKRKKKTKDSLITDEIETSEISQPEPSRTREKNKKAKKESTRVDEKPSQNIPEANFDDDASFLSEALEITAEKNHDLSRENQDLKSILQSIGIGGVKLSVALTRMKHGQSAQEIFARTKKEEP